MSFEWHWLYFLAGVILIVIEVVSLTFYFLPVGIAAIITGIFSLFFENVYLHVFIFVVSNILLLIFISKWRKSRFLKPKESHFVSGLVGQVGVVVEEYKSAQNTGKVKIFSDTWDIYWDKQHEKLLLELKMGDHIKVTSVQGNKVTIEKLKE